MCVCVCVCVCVHIHFSPPGLSGFSEMAVAVPKWVMFASSGGEGVMRFVSCWKF